MFARILTAVFVTGLLAGCSSSGGLSTGSLLGGDGKKKSQTSADLVTPVIKNDPVTRALHVGANSARAVRCGFSFDANRVKTNFLAAEAAGGLPVSEVAKLGNAYSTGFNGVSKGIGDAQTYCTPARVASVKAALTRHLAGDYTPPAPKKVVATSGGGIFGGLFNGDLDEEKGPAFGSDEWWEKQNEATGK